MSNIPSNVHTTASGSDSESDRYEFETLHFALIEKSERILELNPFAMTFIVPLLSRSRSYSII